MYQYFIFWGSILFLLAYLLLRKPYIRETINYDNGTWAYCFYYRYIENKCSDCSYSKCDVRNKKPIQEQFGAYGKTKEDAQKYLDKKHEEYNKFPKSVITRYAIERPKYYWIPITYSIAISLSALLCIVYLDLIPLTIYVTILLVTTFLIMLNNMFKF